MSMTPTEYPLTIYLGQDWSRPFQFKKADGSPLPMPGYTVKAQAREKWGLDTTLIAEFDVDTSRLDTEGIFTLSLSRNVTREITARKGFYDVYLTDSTGDASPYVRGEIEFIQSVTDVGTAGA